MILINVTGGNAIGKTTRATCLYHYLKHNFSSVDVYFNNKILGKFFEGANFFLLGKWVRSKQQWIGLDRLKYLGSWDIRISAMKYVLKQYNPKYYFQEGYFNNHSLTYINLMKLNFLEDLWQIFFLYKNIEDFIERRYKRHTKANLELENVIKGTPWKKHQELCKKVELMKQDEQKYGKIFILGKDEPRDYFVNFLFHTHYNCEQNKLSAIF